MSLLQRDTSYRIAWITGLKGIACYGVFFHHLLLNHVPQTYYGETTSGITWLLSSTPVGVVTNGNFFVFLFILLSTYLIGRSFILYDGQNLRGKIGAFCVKRYFRLMLPILCYGVLRYILTEIAVRLGWNSPLPVYPNLLYVVMHSAVDVFLYSDTAITGPLWMMNLLFAGSYLAMVLSLPDRKTAKRQTILMYFIVFLFLLKEREVYLIGAVFGVLLVDLQLVCTKINTYKHFKLLPKISILAGLFLGGVPSASVVKPFFLYQFLGNERVCHCCGAFLFLLGIIWEETISHQYATQPTLLSRLLQSKPCQFLGKISYSVFLVHEATLTLFLMPICQICDGKGLSSASTTIIVIFLLSAVTILAAWLFNHFVERNTDKFCNYIQV